MNILDLYKELNVDQSNVDEKWTAIKLIRNQLLKECDWTQLPDTAIDIEEKTAWQEYRQALRNLPQAFDLPDDVIFPIRPGGVQ